MEQFDVPFVLPALLLDERRSVHRILDRLDLVEVHGIHGGLGPHHRDASGGQGERRVGLEPGARHRVEPRSVRLPHRHAEFRHGRLAHRRDQLGPMADDALSLDGRADHEAGHIGQEDQRDVERVAQPDEPRHLVRGVHEQHSAQVRRLIRDHTHHVAVQASEAADDLLGEPGLDLEERILVDQTCHQGVHVERLGFVLRDDRCQRPSESRWTRFGRGRGLPIVRGEVAQVRSGRLDGRLVI